MEKPMRGCSKEPTDRSRRSKSRRRKDGIVNRVEFHEGGALVRAEEDTNRDGRVDKWETYADGALKSVAFDTKDRKAGPDD